jgi:hypothetical protein
MNLFSNSFIRRRLISLTTTALVAATSFALAQDPTRAFHVRGAMPIQYVADRPDFAAEQPFLAENDVAMNKMMADMTIKPTGDIDRDFVAMMVPHHQGAVDMAKAELKYGHNEQLRRLAQEIVVTQGQEITVMRLAVGEPLPPSAAGDCCHGQQSRHPNKSFSHVCLLWFGRQTSASPHFARPPIVALAILMLPEQRPGSTSTAERISDLATLCSV